MQQGWGPITPPYGARASPKTSPLRNELYCFGNLNIMQMFATCTAFYETACPLRCSDHTETAAVKPGIGTQLLSLAAATPDKSKTTISHRDSPARYDKNIKHKITLFQ